MRVKTVWQDVHGIVLLDKGFGYSSNQALQQVRRTYRAAKAGHTGTLDPLATGLLPLCLGEASKFAQGLLDADKTYIARLCLGVVTTTGDAEGQVTANSSVQIAPGALADAVKRFSGSIEQIPPMFSALKHLGKPLYELARQEIDIERKPRQVTIYSLKVLGSSFDQDQVSCEAGQAWVDIQVHVSKGTYIRTLGQDIGAQLGCGAHLSALRRTQLGDWSVEQAHSYEHLKTLDEAQLTQCLLPVDAMLTSMQRIELDASQQQLFSNGGRVRVLPMQTGFAQPGVDDTQQDIQQDIQTQVRVYAQEQFLGIARLIHGVLHPIRLIQRAQQS